MIVGQPENCYLEAHAGDRQRLLLDSGIRDDVVGDEHDDTGNGGPPT